MNSHILRIQVYCLAYLVTIKGDGHVLLATNVKDFKLLAKKFVPESLANKIVSLAMNQPMKYRQKPVQEEEYEYESDSSKEPVFKEALRQTIETVTEKPHPYPKVNFEELVQKVKERIQKDFEQTLETTSVKPARKITREYSQEKLPQVSRFVNDRRKETTRLSKPKLMKQEEPTPSQDNDFMFAKITLKENDSYEDYVTPEKERNVFASDDEKADDTVIPTTTLNKISAYTNQVTESPMDIADKTEELKENVEEMEEKSEEMKVKSDEMKAKTEDIWYDDKQTPATEDYINTPPSKSKTTKNRKGTMIPKRDFYKMSSPNYLAKVPIVAEKYDFDEPIPERDREPEVIKPLRGLPPANINGRVKIS